MLAACPDNVRARSAAPDQPLQHQRDAVLVVARGDLVGDREHLGVRVRDRDRRGRPRPASAGRWACRRRRRRPRPAIPARRASAASADRLGHPGRADLQQRRRWTTRSPRPGRRAPRRASASSSSQAIVGCRASSLRRRPVRSSSAGPTRTSVSPSSQRGRYAGSCAKPGCVTRPRTRGRAAPPRSWPRRPSCSVRPSISEWRRRPSRCAGRRAARRSRRPPGRGGRSPRRPAPSSAAAGR